MFVKIGKTTTKSIKTKQYSIIPVDKSLNVAFLKLYTWCLSHSYAKAKESSGILEYIVKNGKNIFKIQIESR